MGTLGCAVPWARQGERCFAFLLLIYYFEVGIFLFQWIGHTPAKSRGVARFARVRLWLALVVLGRWRVGEEGRTQVVGRRFCWFGRVVGSVVPSPFA